MFISKLSKVLRWHI